MSLMSLSAASVRIFVNGAMHQKQQQLRAYTADLSGDWLPQRHSCIFTVSGSHGQNGQLSPSHMISLFCGGCHCLHLHFYHSDACFSSSFFFLPSISLCIKCFSQPLGFHVQTLTLDVSSPSGHLFPPVARMTIKDPAGQVFGLEILFYLILAEMPRSDVDAFSHCSPWQLALLFRTAIFLYHLKMFCLLDTERKPVSLSVWMIIYIICCSFDEEPNRKLGSFCVTANHGLS